MNAQTRFHSLRNMTTLFDSTPSDEIHLQPCI